MAGAFRPLPLGLLGVGVALASVGGPFGSYDTMSLGARILYWGLVGMVGLVLIHLGWALSRLILPRWCPLWADGLAAVLATVALTPIIWLLRGLIDPVLDFADLDPASIGFHTFVVYAGLLVMCRVLGDTPREWTADDAPARQAHLGEALDDDASADLSAADLSAAEPPERRPRLERRLSEDMRGKILHLSGRDHHVEITTDKGVQTLRLRLSDAVAEMEPVPGVLTHRSHWVALDAVTGVERESGARLYLRLRNGDRVPVSRTYRARVAAAGLLD